MQTIKFGEHSVCVWGGMYGIGVTPLYVTIEDEKRLNADDYIQILI